MLLLVACAECKKKKEEKNKKKGNSHDDIWAINQKMFEKAESGITGFSGKKSDDPGVDDILEGDIVLTNKLRKFLDNLKAKKSISPFDAAVNKAWPGARVPYTFASNFRYQSVVRQAIEEYNAKTCIRFVPRRSSDRSYVEFMHGGGCYSMIGRVGGRQQISLGNGCGTKGVAIHEMMHALGFFHEQSRRDRDSYIRINWQNIPGRVRYNFEKYRHGQAETLGQTYDKQSIMHYGNYAFSTNGRKTIESISNPNERLGQRNGLSRIDINQLRTMYKCGGVKPVTPKPTTSVCKDNFSLCTTLAKEGFCRVTFSSWMMNNCKKSCEKCPSKPTLRKCTKRSKNCGYWSKRNFCKDKRYVNYMSKNCRECGKCRD